MAKNMELDNLVAITNLKKREFVKMERELSEIHEPLF
jgi:hypothetical protein